MVTLFWEFPSFSSPSRGSERRISHLPYPPGECSKLAFTEHLLCVRYSMRVTSVWILSPTLHMAASNRVVLFFLYLQVRAANLRRVASIMWIIFTLNIYYTLILRQLLVVYLKFKFNWASCVLSGNLTASTAPTAHLRQPEGIFLSSDSSFP